MFDGTIQGEYVSLEENSKIVMKWKFKDWPQFADCTVTFSGVNDSCDVLVDFKNIPEYDNFGGFIHLDKIHDGWRQNIFKMIHMIFGYHLRDD